MNLSNLGEYKRVSPKSRDNLNRMLGSEKTFDGLNQEECQ